MYFYSVDNLFKNNCLILFILPTILNKFDIYNILDYLFVQ